MKGLLIFVGGLIVGAGATYMVQKNKYEEMVKEELDAMKEHYESRKEQGCGPKLEERPKKTDEEWEEKRAQDRPKNRNASLTRDEVYEANREEIERNKEIISTNGYGAENEDLRGADKYNTPHIVTPDEFGSICGFDVGTFYINEDDTIINERNEVVDDEEIIKITGMSGYEINKHFGEYLNDPDTVYIRNMELKIDYEFLKNE